VTGGKDAQGEVTVKIRARGHVVSGRGTSTDIIEASAKAYLVAINRVAYLSSQRSTGARRAAGSAGGAGGRREVVKRGPGP
jgi:2-isopropylmalate synthase